MALPTSYSWTVLAIGPSGQPSAQGAPAGNRTSGNGKTGIAIPFSADGRGRLALVSGNEQLEKIIMLNLSGLESANPFQGDLGLGEDMVFAIASTKLRTEVRRRINALFRRLQLSDRARLEGAPAFTTDSQNQELTVDIKYINLEEDKPGEVGLKFSLANTAA
jgi:hypothetical protein